MSRQAGDPFARRLFPRHFVDQVHTDGVHVRQDLIDVAALGLDFTAAEDDEPGGEAKLGGIQGSALSPAVCSRNRSVLPSVLFLAVGR